VEKGDKEISNWFKVRFMVWGVDLTLFFKLFLYFYIIYILCIYFICIFERSTGQKYSSQQKTNKMIKTTRIGAGFYKGQYNGINFSIVKAEANYNTKNESVWYWQIGNKVYDTYNSKIVAIQAVKIYIEETY
jgi:hypothetical protein